MTIKEVLNWMNSYPRKMLNESNPHEALHESVKLFYSNPTFLEGV